MTIQTFHILVVKETRAGERRVALIPDDVKTLVNNGHQVFVEHDAGTGAGFTNKDYQNAGALIREITDNNYKSFFADIDLIVRAKRPERAREILENSAIRSGTIMIGALDPLEKNSAHMNEYKQAGILAHSIDQLDLKPDDPMNVLSAMSKIAGRLALLDAIEKFHSVINKIVIIGFGVAGRAAFSEALHQKLPVTVVLTNSDNANEIESRGGKIVLLDKNDNLTQQQTTIKNILLDANIVIATARKAGQPAPLLVPEDTLIHMQSGSVVVDLALSEGGNVYGSEHDETHVTENNIIITNTSGYPKIVPGEASKLWSTASLNFILRLA